MPAPSRTSLEQIVGVGRELLEAGGPDALTMQAVAQRVGVRAPSLYKRVRDRDDLLGLVAAATVEDLGQRLAAGDGSLPGLVRTYRAFAHERPEAFRLLLSTGAGTGALGQAVEPVLRAVAATVGEASALDAARLVVAWVTGFLSMEMAGAFRLGGDLDASFEFGIARLTAALSSTGRGDDGPA